MERQAPHHPTAAEVYVYMQSQKISCRCACTHPSLQDGSDLSDEIQCLVENIPSSKLYSLCKELQMTPQQLADGPLYNWCEEGGDRIELAQALRAVKLKGLAKK